MRVRIAASLLFAAASTAQAAAADTRCPGDALDRHGSPQAMRDFDTAGNQRFNPLFDAGAWHGFLLPADAQDDGGFTGPLVVAEEYAVFLAQRLERLELSDAEGRRIDLASGDTTRCAAPGRLHLRYRLPTLELDLELRFIGPRSAAIRTQLRNPGPHVLRVTPSWSGAVLERFSTTSNETVVERYPRWRPHWSSEAAGVRLSLEGVNDAEALRFGAGAGYHIVRSEPARSVVDGLTYTSTGEEWQIPAGDTHTVWTVQSYYLAGDEIASVSPASVATAFEASEKRWNRYLDRIGRVAAPRERPLAIKAAETLIGNWRAPAGALRHDAVVPSTTARWFNGAWAWDSWKQAAGLAVVDPELARASVLALFDYQIGETDPVRPLDAGMIPDNVFFRRSSERGDDGYNWNERNSKPALSTWAVWEIEQRAPDRAWLEAMYPKLVAYHRWWYRNRDHDRDGLVEFGATRHAAHADQSDQLRFTVTGVAGAPAPDCRANGAPQSYDCIGYALYRRLLASDPNLQLHVPVIEAAAWESGMDNAARFFPSRNHGTPLVAIENRDAEGRLVGWSINQISVDQNSYLAHEKYLLATIARRIGRSADAVELDAAARRLSVRIRRCFFDAKTGYFYDRGLPPEPAARSDGDGCPGTLLVDRGKGPEGFAPLWTGIATRAQGAAAVRVLLDPDDFGTELPFPTLARSAVDFDPKGYWRGRVWLDQYDFALRALARYGSESNANRLCRRLLNRAEGLDGTGPIHENYHPLSGARLGASNFSWSAAHLLLMLERARCR